MRSALFAATALALVLAFSAPGFAMEVGKSGPATLSTSNSIEGGSGQRGAVTGTPGVGGSKGSPIAPAGQTPQQQSGNAGIIVQGGLQNNAGNVGNAGNAGNGGIIVQGGKTAAKPPKAKTGLGGQQGAVSPTDSQAVVAPIDSQGVIAPIDSSAGQGLGKKSIEEIIGEEGHK